MTIGGEERSNKILVGVLAVLILAIVGLTAGIVMVRLRNNTSRPEIVENDDEIVDEILSAIRPMSIEDSEKYLDEKLEEYKNTNLEHKIKMMKVNVYLNGGEPEKAIAAAVDINDENLDDDEKMEYYMTLSEAYESIGDEDESNYYYFEKYLVIYNNVFNGGGGGD